MQYYQWLKQWLTDYVQPSVKLKTYYHYQDMIKLHINPHLGQYPLKSINSMRIQKMVNSLLQSGNKKNNHGLSTNTINAILSIVKNSLKMAHQLGYFHQFKNITFKRPKSIEKPVTCFHFNEQKQIENAILLQKRTSLYGVIFCLYLGLRIGELLALEWEDIDLQTKELVVRKTCYEGKNHFGKFQRMVVSPKTQSSIRQIPLPKQLLPLFLQLKKQSHSSYVLSSKNKPISIRSYQRSFQNLLIQLKIKQRGFHALRHTFATRALECGMDIKTLSEILGHSNSSITLNRYVHSLFKHKQEMMNHLGNLLK